MLRVSRKIHRVTSSEWERSFAVFAGSGRQELKILSDAVSKKDVVALQSGAAVPEQVFDLIRVVSSHFSGIDLQEDLARRLQARSQIIEEKVPLFDSPDVAIFAIAIEAGGERCDEIKPSAEIRQWLKRCNRPDNAWHFEELGQFPEQRKLIDVQAQPAVAEVPGDEEKKTAATPEIEDISGWRAVQAKVLDFDKVPLQPAGDVGILGVVQWRRGVTLLDLAQFDRRGRESFPAEQARGGVGALANCAGKFRQLRVWKSCARDSRAVGCL